MMVLGWVAIALLALAGVAAAYKWLFSTAQVAQTPRAIGKKTYPAVGIRYNLLACKAVQKYYDQRFLAQDAPALPVVGCNVRPCPCRYIHYTDRRTGEDRRVHYGAHQMNTHVANQRRRSERRHAPAFS